MVRDRRGVRPTAAGSSLVAHAERIFAEVEAAEADLAAVLGIRAGKLRVASFPSAGATLMPLAVARFRQAHPEVALTLAEGEPEQIAPRLRAGEFDLALLFEFPGARERPGQGLRSVRLLEDPMHLALPAEHPLAAKPELSLADLRDQQWVQTSALESLRPSRGPLLSGSRVRALRGLRERRLRHRAGPRGGGRGGGLDPAAGADPGALRDRRPGAGAAQPGAQGDRGDDGGAGRGAGGERDDRAAPGRLAPLHRRRADDAAVVQPWAHGAGLTPCACPGSRGYCLLWTGWRRGSRTRPAR